MQIPVLIAISPASDMAVGIISFNEILELSKTGHCIRLNFKRYQSSFLILGLPGEINANDVIKGILRVAWASCVISRSRRQHAMPGVFSVALTPVPGVMLAEHLPFYCQVATFPALRISHSRYEEPLKSFRASRSLQQGSDGLIRALRFFQPLIYQFLALAFERISVHYRQ